MIRFAQTTVLAAALLVATGSAHAAPNLFEAKASISNLKVEVIDLRPQDGVAAAFLPGKSAIKGEAEWSNGFYLFDIWPTIQKDDGSVVVNVQTQQGLKDVIGGPDFQFSLPDSQASFGRSGGTYTASLAVQGLSLLENSHFDSRPTGEFLAGATISTRSWVLKPGTEVRISGVFDLAMSNDLGQLTGDLGGYSGWPFGPLQEASSGAFMSLSVVGDATGVIIGPSSASRLISSDVLLMSDKIDQSLIDGFVLVARNTGDADVILNSEIAFGSRFTVATAVPEPSTWALMLTGLGLMGVFARRRRAA